MQGYMQEIQLREFREAMVLHHLQAAEKSFNSEDLEKIMSAYDQGETSNADDLLSGAVSR